MLRCRPGHHPGHPESRATLGASADADPKTLSAILIRMGIAGAVWIVGLKWFEPKALKAAN